MGSRSPGVPASTEQTRKKRVLCLALQLQSDSPYWIRVFVVYFYRTTAKTAYSCIRATVQIEKTVRKVMKDFFDSTCSCYLKVIITFQMEKNKKLERQRHNQKEHRECSRALESPLCFSAKPWNSPCVKGHAERRGFQIEAENARRHSSSSQIGKYCKLRKIWNNKLCSQN